MGIFWTYLQSTSIEKNKMFPVPRSSKATVAGSTVGCCGRVVAVRECVRRVVALNRAVPLSAQRTKQALPVSLMLAAARKMAAADTPCVERKPLETLLLLLAGGSWLALSLALAYAHWLV